MKRRTLLKNLGLAGVALIASDRMFGVVHATAGANEEDIERLVGNRPAWEPKYNEKEVYKDENVVIRQIDDHTWEGNGHLMANETIYLVEGDNESILIDAGTHIHGLRKIVEGITSKPVTLIATHVHPDHTGDAINDWENIWINAADEVNTPMFMKGYPGEKRYLTDGQTFDLGGRIIETIFTPGHTPGSTTFLERAKGWGFSGDAFGSGNLLITTNLTTQITTCEKMAYFMQKYGIGRMYPGHYMGSNMETLQRVKDIGELCAQLREGTVKGEPQEGGMLKNVYSSRGVRLNYNDEGIR